jgi:hypothetical protein
MSLELIAHRHIFIVDVLLEHLLFDKVEDLDVVFNEDINSDVELLVRLPGVEEGEAGWHDEAIVE